MLKFNSSKHEYTYGQKRLCSVSEVLDYSLGKFFSSNERLKDLGTDFHRITRDYDNGIESECPEEQKERLIQYKKFLVVYQPKYLTIEQPVMDLDNGYAGTPDRVAIINNKCVILDLKRSSSVDKRYAYQTAAYKKLVEKSYSIKVDERWCVMITDKKFKIEPYRNEMDVVVFTQMLINYKNRN